MSATCPKCGGLLQQWGARTHHCGWEDATVPPTALADREAVQPPVAEGEAGRQDAETKEGSMKVTDEMVDRFLRWPLPYSVCADRCATRQENGRSGTNLLTATEARQMLEYVLAQPLALGEPAANEREDVGRLIERANSRMNAINGRWSGWQGDHQLYESLIIALSQACAWESWWRGQVDTARSKEE